MPRLTVIFVRHGEREDEVWEEELMAIEGDYYDKKISKEEMETRVAGMRKLSRRQRYDPCLTPDGYEQADVAMYRIVLALKSDMTRHRIAVFASPMRRTIGTSLMLSTAVTHDYHAAKSSRLEWILPLVPAPTLHDASRSHGNDIGNDESAPFGEKSVRASTVIPIVVMDGLCDCTSLMRKFGGHKSTMGSGWFYCSTLWNDYREATGGTLTGVDRGFLRDELHKMSAVIRNQTPVDTVSWERQEVLVQYYKMERDVVPAHILPLPSFTPMTGPVALQDPHATEIFIPEHLRMTKQPLKLEVPPEEEKKQEEGQHSHQHKQLQGDRSQKNNHEEGIKKQQLGSKNGSVSSSSRLGSPVPNGAQLAQKVAASETSKFKLKNWRLKKKKDPKIKPKKKPRIVDLSAVEHAVMTAARSNANTAIIVTHREAFYDVIRCRCQDSSLKFARDSHVPYCGIATFTVDVNINDTDYQNMEWQLVSLESPEKFDVDCLP